MPRVFWYALLSCFVTSCAQSVEPPKAKPVVVADESAAEREIRIALATPQGKAIDEWLIARGFMRCPAGQAIARGDGTDSDLQIPYWNAVLKEKGVLEQVHTAGMMISGTVVIRAGEFYGTDGNVYVWDPVKNGLVEVLRPADYAPAPSRPGSLAPHKTIKVAFREWAECWAGGVGGAALGCLVTGPGYETCFGATSVGTTFNCGLRFWTSVL